MACPFDRHLDLNIGEDADMPSQDNIWHPSFVSPNGPLTIGDYVMKNDITATVVARNLFTPRITRSFPNGLMSWLFRTLWLSMFSVQALYRTWANAFLLELVKLSH
ncbi:hypothetical protein ACFX1Z_022889 [Malus domestica]